jgi:asparagine synthase (glutamine-hydrolysing)
MLMVDKTAHRVLLTRDLIGIMPLYYSTNPFGVASERKALPEGGKQHEVRAGETLWLDYAGNVLQRRQFDPYALHLQPVDIEHVQFLFREAVRKRIEHSERPVCVALSGGLDSSLVLRAAVDIKPDIEAITVVVEPNSEELENARRFAASLGVKHTVVQLREDEINFQRVLYHLEDARWNPVKLVGMLRNYYVAKHAPGIVILCGEGADEIGCGYPSHAQREGLDLEWYSLTTLRGMPAINLDRVNKGGMAWGKEYRTPFLDRSLVLYMMSVPKEHGKAIYRWMARDMGIPDYILNKEKYGAEDAAMVKLAERLHYAVRGSCDPYGVPHALRLGMPQPKGE